MFPLFTGPLPFTPARGKAFMVPLPFRASSIVLCLVPLLCASSCEAELTATLHSEQYSSLFAFSSSVSTEGHVVLLVAVVGIFSTLEVISVVITLLFRISTVVVVDIAGVPVLTSVLSELVLMVLVVMEVKVVFALSLVVTDFCLFFMASSALSFLACLVPL